MIPGDGKVADVSVSVKLREAESGNWAEVAMLVIQAQDGDREAFGVLVEQFQPTVQAIALRRLGNLSEALELTQEVFLHVLRRLHQLREPERFAGWLRQVTIRMSINRATRRVSPTTVETGILEGAYEHEVEPVQELISRERAEILWGALGRLKRMDRETLVAFYIRGQSLLEMAHELDVPLGTVKRRLHTARKRLRAELESSVACVDEWTESLTINDDEVECVGCGIGSDW